MQPVTGCRDSHLHTEYLDGYHYLGYQPLPGAQPGYLARAAGRVVALLGFGAAAWKTRPRDRFIGWTDQQRRHRLHLVINHARFLILPWVHCWKPKSFQPYRAGFHSDAKTLGPLDDARSTRAVPARSSFAQGFE
ncbi:MAG: Druantia anti-phage system protein DruA [Methylococcales bacterium]